MVNTLRFGDIARLQELVPVAVKAARAHLEDTPRRTTTATVDEPLNEYRDRVKVWQQDSLLDVPAQSRTRREQRGRTRPRPSSNDDDHEAAHGRRAAAAHPRRAGWCPMSYDSLTNRGDYLSPHYLAEVLPRELAKKDGLRARWAERDKEGTASPVKELRALRRDYFAARPDLADFAQRAADGDPVTEDERRTHDKAVKKQNDDVLRALGFAASRGVVDVERSGETFGVPVAYQGQNVVAIDCGWAADTDAALDPDRAGRLLDPVEIGSNERITAGAKLARWLFDTDEPPRYVLLLHGGVVILADRLTWAEGRYLAVSLDTAIDRADQAELETIAALFSADVLQPPAEGGSEQLAHWVDESRKHAVGVSGELREGLRESVQIIANEVLDRIRSHGLEPGDVADPGDLARELGRDALRYLYRILFLLYAEARPELGILPADDQDYVAGYSMQRLGELAARRLIGEEARTGFHLYESLDLLFRMVNDGHRARGNASTEGLSEGEGLRFESLKADLFEPSKTRLIGRIPDPRYDERGAPARHPAAGRGAVQGAAPADARQGQREEGKEPARRVHLLRPARHQPARRGVRGADVLHRVHRRRGTVRGRQEGRPVRRILDDPRIQGPRLHRRRVRHGEGRERVPDRGAGPVPARVVRLPAGRPRPADQRLLLHASLARPASPCSSPWSSGSRRKAAR